MVIFILKFLEKLLFIKYFSFSKDYLIIAIHDGVYVINSCEQQLVNTVQPLCCVIKQERNAIGFKIKEIETIHTAIYTMTKDHK